MNTIADAVDRLSGQLPLRQRQRSLPTGYADVHRHVLDLFARHGRPPSRAELQDRTSLDVEVVLERLAKDDLVVLSEGAVVGAYPFTVEETPHRLTVDGRESHAMCSLDAVAVAPVFDREVVIESECAVTGRPIHIHQRGRSVLTAEPADLRLGIRWVQPTECAAHSMCREMVFLADPEVAARWRDVDENGAGIFTLDEGVEFGIGFFGPLLEE